MRGRNAAGTTRSRGPDRITPRPKARAKTERLESGGIWLRGGARRVPLPRCTRRAEEAGPRSAVCP
jgi:hypothetical protein